MKKIKIKRQIKEADTSDCCCGTKVEVSQMCRQFKSISSEVSAFTIKSNSIPGYQLHICLLMLARTSPINPQPPYRPQPPRFHLVSRPPINPPQPHHRHYMDDLR